VNAIMRGLEREPARRFPSMTALIAELTRPQLRRSTAWIAAGAFGVAAVTATAVIVVTGSTEPSALPNEAGPELLEQVKQLDLKLQAAVEERRRLRDELVKAIAERDQAKGDLIELEDELQQALQKKDEEIELLNDEVRELQKTLRKSKPPGQRRTIEELRGVTDVMESNLRACFGEWRDRNPRGRIHFTVSLTINENGSAEAPSTSEVPDLSLPLCVRAALLRVRYPAGVKRRAVFEVSSGSGASPTVRISDAREAPPGEIIELDSTRPRPPGLEKI
jgi:hypothetical protein